MPNNPHDSLFKAAFSDVVYAATYGDQKLEICLLFEHKSKPEKFPHLQLLRYMLEAWDTMVSNKEKLKAIVPIVVYHGSEKWSVRPFHSYFGNLDSHLKAFFPGFEYLVTNFNEIPTDTLLKLNPGILRPTMLIFKHGKEEEFIKVNFKEIFRGLEDQLENQQVSNQLIVLFVYLWSVSKIADEEFMDLLNSLPQEMNDLTMTTYEQIIQRGVKQGKIEGKVEKENFVITQGVKNGLSLGMIAELTGLSIDEVEKRIKRFDL
ncbi:MAG: Rpn family recombination-promoting nuclease/putative transposase [Bacteroidota bacterium]